MNCQDDAPAVTPEDMAAQAAAYPKLDGYVRHRAERAICGVWDLPASTPLVTEPVEGDIPTLILAGTYDPITPPEWSRATAENLSNSYYYEFRSAGHSVSEDNPCAYSIMAAFLNDPTTAPDASCIADVPGPEFVLPQDVYIAASIYEVHYGEVGYTQFENDLLFGSLLVSVVGTGILVMIGIVRLVRRRKQEIPPDRMARFSHPLAGLVATFYVGFFFAMRSALRALNAANPMMLRFGLPQDFRPLLIIPVVMAVLTVGMVILAVLAWVRGTWLFVERVLYSLVTLAAVVFIGLWAYWGLPTLLF